MSTAEGFQYPLNLLGYLREDGEMLGAVPLAIHHFAKRVSEEWGPSATLEGSLCVTRILDAIQRPIDMSAPAMPDS